MTDRLENEPDKAYEAYIYYRDLGKERNLKEAFVKWLQDNDLPINDEKGNVKEPNGSWKRWRRKYSWEERAREYYTRGEKFLNGVTTTISNNNKNTITLQDYLQNTIRLRHDTQQTSSTSTLLCSEVQVQLEQLFNVLKNQDSDAFKPRPEKLKEIEFELNLLSVMVTSLKKVSDILAVNLASQTKVMEIDKMYLFLQEQETFQDFEAKIIQEERSNTSAIMEN